MEVSSEFQNAVKEKNILRIRIMLKDSLLIDRSFSMFKKLLEHTEKYGVKVLMEAEDSLERADKPWTVDLMNSELVGLVNDFTKEHIQYVMEIIREILPVEKIERQSSLDRESYSKPRRKELLPPKDDMEKLAKKMIVRLKEISGKTSWKSRGDFIRVLNAMERFMEEVKDI